MTNYKKINAMEIEPDFQSSRRYGPIMKKLFFQLFSDKQSILFTDDVDKSADILSRYALHVDPLGEGMISPLERAMIGLSLTSEEVAESPQLYVDFTSEDNERCYDPGNGDGVNQRRFNPRIFSELIITDLGDPSYREWSKSLIEKTGITYAFIDNYRKDFLLFTDPNITSLMLKFFEAENNKILFINKLPSQSKEKEAADMLKGLQMGLLNEKRYSQDNADSVQKIPYTVWICPFKLYVEFEQLYDESKTIVPYEYPDSHFMLHKPLDKWLSGLPEQFRDLDEKRRNAGFMMPVSNYISSQLVTTLEFISSNAQQLRKDKNLNDDALSKFLGVSSEELIYLESFKGRQTSS